MNDDKIIALYFERSEEAITETDRKYGGYCRAMTFNILGSREDSEECVNDTYMKLWERIPPTRPVRLGAFISAIARTLALDMRKARERLRRGGGYEAISFDEISECLPSGTGVESAAESGAALKAVESFIRTLSREKQIMFIRRYFYFSTFAQIAADLNTTEGRVKMTLQRTREKLRKYLEKEGIDV